MECQYIQPQLIDYVDKNVSPETATTISNHIQQCSSCRKEVEELAVLFRDINQDEGTPVPSSIRNNFMNEIQAAKSDLDRIKPAVQTAFIQKRFINQLLRVAAIALLIISSFAAGYYFRPGSGDSIEKMQYQIENIEQDLMIAKLQMNSPSQRILAASYFEEVIEPDNTIINALIHAMNSDENVNVRMAAIHALSKFRNLTSVRNALIESLDIQTDPVLQLSLINLMVEMQEKEAIEKIQNVIRNEKTNESVRNIGMQSIEIII